MNLASNGSERCIIQIVLGPVCSVCLSVYNYRSQCVGSLFTRLDHWLDGYYSYQHKSGEWFGVRRLECVASSWACLRRVRLHRKLFTNKQRHNNSTSCRVQAIGCANSAAWVVTRMAMRDRQNVVMIPVWSVAPRHNLLLHFTPHQYSIAYTQRVGAKRLQQLRAHAGFLIIQGSFVNPPPLCPSPPFLLTPTPCVIPS